MRVKWQIRGLQRTGLTVLFAVTATSVGKSSRPFCHVVLIPDRGSYQFLGESSIVDIHEFTVSVRCLRCYTLPSDNAVVQRSENQRAYRYVDLIFDRPAVDRDDFATMFIGRILSPF